MTTLVRVITQEAGAAVLSYPRDADPVFGAELTEVATLPPHYQQTFGLGAGRDLVIVELPVGGADEAPAAAAPPPQAESEAA